MNLAQRSNQPVNTDALRRSAAARPPRKSPVARTLDRMGASQLTSGVLKIGGDELQWHIARRGGSSSMYDNYRGLAVEIVLDPGKTKPLRIEFPFKTFFWSLPDQKASFERLLLAEVNSAIAEGWSPHKRGKVFIHSASSASDPKSNADGGLAQKEAGK